ncbi:MAG: hypothetical protein BM556_06220 [Bacteriovorax sp. MedPE-SWde]|nr:MAG: hypothetical protein BM556_06220 [Bacteriovorax sp. MedPE-SWde]
MKYSILLIASLISFSSFADSFKTCEEKVLSTVQEKIVASGGLLAAQDGFQNYDVKWMGDGFFDVYHQVWDKDPEVWPSHDTYEVVIGANCEIIYADLIETHM